MNYIFMEDSSIQSIPKNIEKIRNKIRFECVLQTADTKNRNGRIYPKTVLDESIKTVTDRIKKRMLLGELDHPIDSNPIRQCTVRYNDVSHIFVEIGWDGNKLIGVLESLMTPKGEILKNLALDKIPIGFSYRGMGEAKKTEDNTGVQIIQSPLMTITWDSVSFPSHEGAHLIKINENTINRMVSHVKNNKLKYDTISESYNFLEFEEIKECDGLICTKEGVCYLPNDFDYLVNKRIITLKNKFNV